MNFLKRLYQSLRKMRKFSISDPETFEEIWSFNSNRIRVISLLLIVVFLFSFGLTYMLGGFSNGYFNEGDISIERDQLEQQNQEIISLSDKIASQEMYIENIKRILNGEVPIDTPLDSVPLANEIDLDSLETSATDSEEELAEKLKNDMLTDLDDNTPIAYFGSPVLGVVSQEFDKKNHPGIDVVTEKDRTVKACHAGTVIYSGYTRKDGHILLIDHGNLFISVYKHNKRVLKGAGAKVKLGDPIAIVGNTGENSDGPHLHFELWYDQVPVNPSDYIRFKR